MTTSKTLVVLLCLSVALAIGKPAADTSLNVSLFSAVEQQTAAANKALSALPVTCTRDVVRSIQEAKVKVFGDVASCSVSAIIKDIAYIMIDSADFGSDVWNDGVELVADIKACMKESTVLDKVQCLDDTLSGSSSEVMAIHDAIKQLVEQLVVIIPDISNEIKKCQGKSMREYKLILDGLVKKAKTC